MTNEYGSTTKTPFIFEGGEKFRFRFLADTPTSSWLAAGRGGEGQIDRRAERIFSSARYFFRVPFFCLFTLAYTYTYFGI